MKLERRDRFTAVLPRQGGMKTSATIYLHESMAVEEKALEQVRDAASIDEESVVLATPDIHVGYGVPIGSVLATPGYVSPAAVGYDINCGMRLMRTGLGADEVDVVRLAEEIRRELPLGEGKKNPAVVVEGENLDRILARGVPGLASVARRSKRLAAVLDPEEIDASLGRVEDGGQLSGEPGVVSRRAKKRGAGQLGTLGGGNHFVEIQRVDEIRDPVAARALGLEPGQAVVMIHSGSRGLGHQVAGEAMALASHVAAVHGLPLPNSQLAYMPADTREGREYLGAMNAAANYAFANRQVIGALVGRAFGRVSGGGLELIYDVSHNVAKLERHGGRRLHVHRKGATRAFPAARMEGTEFAELGQPVLIPGSMGTASYVLRAASEARGALYSVNHGAGRVMSRTAAAGKVRRRDGKILKPGRISDKRFHETMRGVHLVCEDPRTIKEEAPDAYKDIDLVVETVVGARLADVVARLVPLAVLKG